MKQTLPTSLEKGGASRNQGKSKIEKQNKMKSKIKKHITLSSTTSPLSSQERGRGEFAKNRTDFVKQTLPTSLEKGGASRNQGKSKIEKQNKMKSKINELNAPSSTTLPLSSQERGRGEFAKSRSEFAKSRTDFVKQTLPDPPLKRAGGQRNQGKSKIEKQNK